MPQFDFTTYSSQIFWFAIFFTILYLSLKSIIIPRIRAILSERKGVIDNDLNLAKDLDEKIDAIEAKTNELRRNASSEYQSKIEESARAALKEREKSLDELKAKIEGMTQKSRQEIKDFVEKSQKDGENAVKALIQTIKTKIFS